MQLHKEAKTTTSTMVLKLALGKSLRTTNVVKWASVSDNMFCLRNGRKMSKFVKIGNF